MDYCSAADAGDGWNAGANGCVDGTGYAPKYNNCFVGGTGWARSALVAYDV